MDDTAYPIPPDDSEHRARHADEFGKELTSLLNRYSIDNLTNTPDFILSEVIQKYIYDMKIMNEKRDKWHGWNQQSAGKIQG